MAIDLKISRQTSTWCNWLTVLTCAAIPISLGMTNVLMAMLLLLLIVSLGSAAVRQTWMAHPVAWLLLALFLWIVLGVSYTSADSHDYVLHIKKFSKLLVASMLLATLTTDQWRSRCLKAFCVGMAVILVSQYAEIFWDLPWTVTKNQGWGVDHIVFGDYITQGIMVTFMLCLALTRALNGELRDKKTWLWAAVAGLCLLSVTGLSAGRTAYVLALISVTVVLALRWSGKRLAMAVAVLAVVLVAVYVSAKGVQARISEAHQEVSATLRGDTRFTSLGGRLENYRQSLQLIRERPIIGWGTGSFHEQSCRVAITKEMCKQANWHPHNQYFLFAIQGGLLAGILFIGVLTVAAIQLRRSSKDARMIGLTFLAIFAVDSLFNSSLFSARESHFFTIFLAVVLAGQLNGCKKERGVGDDNLQRV